MIVMMTPVFKNLSVEMFAHEFKFDDEEKKQFPEMYKLYTSRLINDSFCFAEKKRGPKITMRLQKNYTKMIAKVMNLIPFGIWILFMIHTRVFCISQK